jgi:hypothetical protein
VSCKQLMEFFRPQLLLFWRQALWHRLHSEVPDGLFARLVIGDELQFRCNTHKNIP